MIINHSNDEIFHFLSDLPTSESLKLTPEEVETAYLHVKNSSNDFIPKQFFIYVHDTLMPILTKLLNVYVEKSNFPNLLKYENIYPLYKGKGCKLDPLSYRPISAVYTLSKILEKCMQTRLCNALESKLTDNQHGFRKFRSCITAWSVFKHKLTTALDTRNNLVGAVFIDLRKAFDYVPLLPVLKSLVNNFQVDPSLVKLIASFMTARKFSINIANFCSEPFPYNSACPQGSTLAPLLFNVFIDDLSKTFQLDHLLFADDLVFFIYNNNFPVLMSMLSDGLTKISDWCSNHGVQINFCKSNFMIIGKDSTNKHPEVKELFLNDLSNKIARVNTFKYLGIFLDDSLNFKIHAEYVRDKISGSLKCLYKLRRFFNFQLCKTVFHSFVMSTILYGLAIWGTVHHSFITPIQKLINRFIWSYSYPNWFSKSKNNRIKIYPSHTDSSLLQKFNLLTINEYMRLQTLKFVFTILKFGSKVVYLNRILTFNPKSRRQHLVLPSHQYKIRETCITYVGSKLWNSLPPNIRDINLSVQCFLCKINVWLLQCRNSDYTT